MSDGVRKLLGSKNQRKVIIVTRADDVREVPAGIQLVQTNDVSKVVIEIRNRYLLRFQPSDPAARVEVILKEPLGLPQLRAAWKARP